MPSRAAVLHAQTGSDAPSTQTMQSRQPPNGLKVGMLAKMRDEDAGIERGVENGSALGGLDLLAVDR